MAGSTKLLTTKEAAELRRRTPQALVMERRRGEGPPYVIDGGRVLYRADDLDRWIDDHTVTPVEAVRSRRNRARVPAKDQHEGRASRTNDRRATGT